MVHRAPKCFIGFQSAYRGPNGSTRCHRAYRGQNKVDSNDDGDEDNADDEDEDDADKASRGFLEPHKIT